MKLDEYFDAELKAALLHAALGAVAGYASFLSNSASLAILFAVIAAGAGYAFSVYYLKQETKKWYGSAFLLLLSWLVIWTLFYNIALR